MSYNFPFNLRRQMVPPKFTRRGLAHSILDATPGAVTGPRDGPRGVSHRARRVLKSAELSYCKLWAMSMAETSYCKYIVMMESHTRFH